MEMETLGWIAAGWLTVSVVASLILGRLFRHTTATLDENELNDVLTRKRVVRYMRNRKPAAVATVGKNTKTEKNAGLA